MSGSVGIAPVMTPEVGGTTVSRNALEREVARSLHIARMVALRARRWLMEHAEETTVEVAIGVTESGAPVTREVVIPDDVLDAVKVHGKIVGDMLKEQRERAKMVKGQLPLSDAEFEAELHRLAAEHLRAMPAAEFEALKLERGAIEAEAKALDEETI